MSEYKEFWIDNSNETNKNFFLYNVKRGVMDYNFEGAIHVIEYAAFKKLQKDWEQAATQNYADKCEIEKLKKQNEIMREALEFYAKESNWLISAENEFSQIKRTISKDDSESWSYQASPESKNIVQCYGGKRARQALKDVEGVG